MTAKQQNKTRRPVAAEDAPQTVAQAIRQVTPFRTLRHEALVSMLLTTEALRRPLLELLADYDGLTPQQYNVLRILRGAGAEGLPTLEIAERMIERTPGVTRLIDRLEAKGLVQRERCPTDRRQVFCLLTKAGGKLVEQLDGPVDAIEVATMGGLDDRELRSLLQMLDRIRHHLQSRTAGG